MDKTKALIAFSVQSWKKIYYNYIRPFDEQNWLIRVEEQLQTLKKLTIVDSYPGMEIVLYQRV